MALHHPQRTLFRRPTHWARQSRRKKHAPFRPQQHSTDSAIRFPLVPTFRPPRLFHSIRGFGTLSSQTGGFGSKIETQLLKDMADGRLLCLLFAPRGMGRGGTTHCIFGPPDSLIGSLPAAHESHFLFTFCTNYQLAELITLRLKIGPRSLVCHKSREMRRETRNWCVLRLTHHQMAPAYEKHWSRDSSCDLENQLLRFIPT